MGAKGPRPYHKAMDLSQWNPLPSTRDSRRILRNRFTGKEIEEYSVVLTSVQEVDHYYDIFHWRLGSDCLVNTTNYELTQHSDHCGVTHKLLLYVERVYERIGAYKRLLEEDAVCALQTALEGFHEIYKRFGYVDVEESMFCITAQNKLRIWLSEDLASHTPRSPYMEKRTQIDMVNNIISIIDGKLDRQHTIKKFMSSICGTPKFDEAKFLVLMFMRQRSIEPKFSLQITSELRTYGTIEQQLNSKHSLSRLLQLHQDEVSEHPKLLYSTVQFQPTKATHEHFTTTCTTNGHLRQPSADSQPKKNILGDMNRSMEKTGMEAVLSGISTPVHLSSIVETQQESKESNMSKENYVVIPRLPISRKNSDTKRKTITFNELGSNKASTPVAASNSTTPKDSIRQVNATQGKVSLKNLRRITPKEIRIQLNRIRRTFSICLTSRKALVPAENHMRYHASELVEPHQIISYSVITSDGSEIEQRGSQIESKFI